MTEKDPETNEICIICDDEEDCGKSMDECADRNIKDTLPRSTADRRVPIKKEKQGAQEEKSCKTCGNSYCREMVLEYKLHKCPENGCSDWKPKTPTESGDSSLIEHVDSSFVGPPKSGFPVNTGQDGQVFTWLIWMDKCMCEARQPHPDFNHWMCYYRNPPVPCTMENCLKSINHYEKTKKMGD